MEAAVKESRKRRRGTVVQSLKAVAGSSELATVAAAPPVQRAVAATASLARVRQRDRVAMLFGRSQNGQGKRAKNTHL